jgi:hypothetical protein
MDYNNLSTEEKAKFAEQYEAEQKLKANGRKKEKDAYKDLKNIAVEFVFAKLLKSSQELEIAKEKYYNEFDPLLELKCDLYSVKDDQKSHTWTNEDNTLRIITGYNEIDKYDDTKGVGLVKINNWLDSKVDEESKDAFIIVRELLKPNSNGDLKASRVLDLLKIADEIGDPELLEGVKIIHESRRTVKSNTYIKAQFVNEEGDWQWLPLSFSNV